MSCMCDIGDFLETSKPEKESCRRDSLVRESSKGEKEPRRPLGIDLENRADEVKKILIAKFGRKIRTAGYDPEDVLQEVYRGLLARNRGTCPWDPRKSSFGHYVYMVCSCVLNNYHRKQSRIHQFEQIGVLGVDRGQRVEVDASTDKTAAAPTLVEELSQMAEAAEDLAAYMRARRGPGSSLAWDVLPLMVGGATRVDIARVLGVTPDQASRAITYIRSVAREWQAGE